MRIPEPEYKKIFLAVSKQAISVVYAEDTGKKLSMGKEFIVVSQRAHNEFDCIENVFVTYTCKEKSDDKFGTKAKQEEEESKGGKDKEYEINKVSLHYFEKFFDSTHRLKRATYNVFDLTEDFLYMLKQCGLVIPSVKTKLINRISKFKKHVLPVHLDLPSVENFDEALKVIKDKTISEIGKFNTEKRDPFFRLLETETKRMNDEYEARTREFEIHKQALLEEAWEIINMKPAYMIEEEEKARRR